ncbi:MAG TPA: hypothetical protein VER96_12100 [Polyangiaceae bacterium]|nr:hypothetical protein [Polyangiaceae bacterium]
MRFDLKQAAASFVVLSSLFGIPSVANADVAACVQAHASGQREAKAGRLKAASDLFAACVSEHGCPDAIRAECAEFRKSTQRDLPTLIFAAIDAQGGDLIQVRVSADDRVLTEKLDGRPIALDPGQHHFKFELASGEILESEVLVREGEKNRIVSVHAKAAPKAAEETPAPSNEAAAGQHRLPTGFWVASGVGAAALVSFGAFALAGHGKQSTLDDCAPNCSPSNHADYDAMKRDYLIADISLGVAVASAGVATWLFFSSKPSKPEHAASAFRNVSVTPLVSTRGAGLVLSASAF